MGGCLRAERRLAAVMEDGEKDGFADAAQSCSAAGASQYTGDGMPSGPAAIALARHAVPD